MKALGIFVSILILSGFSALHCGAMIYHSDGSAQNIQFIHDTLVQNGDTITLPAGAFTWTTHVTITKGITLQGLTTTNSDNGTYNDQTLLVDNLNRSVPGGEGYLHCTTNAGQSLRITGITFTGAGGNGNLMFKGAIRLSGTSDQVRIDHCHFSALHHLNYIAVYSSICGVADHIVLDNLPPQNGQQRVFN